MEAGPKSNRVPDNGDPTGLFNRISAVLTVKFPTEEEQKENKKEKKKGQWERSKVDQKNGITVWKRSNPDPNTPFDQTIVEGHLDNITVDEVAKLMHITENRKKWDPNLKDLKEIPNSNLIYFSNKGMKPIWERDAAARRIIKRLDADTDICTVESVVDDRMPVNEKEYVRSTQHGSGTAIFRNGTGCTVRILGCVDPGGSLAVYYIAGWVTGGIMHDMLLNLKKLVTENNDKKKKNKT
jgi:hypothetical protein